MIELPSNAAAPRHSLFSWLMRSTGLKRFGEREDGTAAIEFALVMSLLLVPMWLGFSEAASMQQRSTVLNTTTAMVADMISQYQVVTPQLLNDIMETADHVVGGASVTPGANGETQLQLMVMGVLIPQDKGGATEPPKVAWSMSNSGATTCALSRPLPAGVATAAPTDRFVIVVEGELNYEPLVNYQFLDQREFKHRAIFAPRVSAAPPGPNPCP